MQTDSYHVVSTTLVLMLVSVDLMPSLLLSWHTGRSWFPHSSQSSSLQDFVENWLRFVTSRLELFQLILQSERVINEMWNWSLKIWFSSPFQYSVLETNTSILAEPRRDSNMMVGIVFLDMNKRDRAGDGQSSLCIQYALYLLLPSTLPVRQSIRFICLSGQVIFSCIISVCVWFNYAPDIHTNQIFAKWSASGLGQVLSCRHSLKYTYISKGDMSSDITALALATKRDQ